MQNQFAEETSGQTCRWCKRAAFEDGRGPLKQTAKGPHHSRCIYSRRLWQKTSAQEELAYKGHPKDQFCMAYWEGADSWHPGLRPKWPLTEAPRSWGYWFAINAKNAGQPLNADLAYELFKKLGEENRLWIALLDQETTGSIHFRSKVAQA